MKRSHAALFALSGALSGAAILAVPALAWWPAGHTILAKASVLALPEEVPDFFRSGGDMVGHMAQDADVAKQRATPNLNDLETPEHYLDRELLQGRELPATRTAYLKLLHELKVEPREIGTLPYAVAEWTERLTVAFAEHRKWPKNPYIRQKCLFYAGFIAHYSQDLCMPLHTTVHHNGRAGADGKSPGTGIHNKVDALIEKLEMKPAVLARGQQPVAYAALLPAIVEEMAASHRLVDRVYELEPKLPPTEGKQTYDAEVVRFAEERARATVRFTGSLYLTAWRKSASLRLPPFLEREEAG